MPRNRYASIQDRILRNRRVDDAGCWIWTRSKLPKGYGHFSLSTAGVRRDVLAHRASYEAFVGPIPADAHLDHLCRNTACVNPDHLEPVTCHENLHRSPYTRASINREKTECPQGHPYSGANLLIQSDGSRKCRTCQRAAERRCYERRLLRAAGIEVVS